MPESLLESVLFGHARGSFTGAFKDHRGLFEEANGGTLFLDEIGDMPLPMQAKLLRVLEEGEIRRVGSNDPVRVDVRIISATHKNLRAEAEAGTFRRDLYYRLDVLRIALPPLRERSGDIVLLARQGEEDKCRAGVISFTRSRSPTTHLAFVPLVDLPWLPPLHAAGTLLRRAHRALEAKTMDREMIDILTFGACLGALARTIFGWRIDLHCCVAIGAGVVYTAHRGFDVAHMLSFLPPHAIEAAAALYFGSILVNWVRSTPSRTPRYTPRRLA